MAEIFAAELRADAERLRQLVHLLLHGAVAEGVAVLGTKRGQIVEIAAGGKLHRLHRQLRRGAADDDGEVVGRAGGGAERQNLLLEKRDHAVVGEDRRRRLKEKRLVGRAAAFVDEQKIVFVLVLYGSLGVDFHLR